MNSFIVSGSMCNVEFVSEIQFDTYTKVFAFTSNSRSLHCKPKVEEVEKIQIGELSSNRDINCLVNDSVLKNSRYYKITQENGLLWTNSSYSIIKVILTQLLSKHCGTNGKFLITIDDANTEFRKEYDNDAMFFTKLSKNFDILFIKNGFERRDITITQAINLENLK